MNIFNLFDDVVQWWKSLNTSRKPTPADFRRKFRGRAIGASIDHNSRNRGQFMGGIVPMKRRFKGVSRTAK